MYPRDFIDKIKESVNLVELIQEYTELKKIGRYIWTGKCPHPKHDDSTASLIVYTNHNSWCCYGCHAGKKAKDNYGSDCIAFIQWINEGKLSWRESVEYLAKKINLPIPNDNTNKIFRQNLNLNNKYIRDLNDDAIEYCTQRGLDYTDIEKFKLGYDKATNRLTFPLLDRYNNIIGFNKRRLNEDQSMKYIHSSNNEVFNKASYLYNINNVDTEYEYIFIAEGVMDVILATKYGLKNVVCTLGSAFREEHYDIITKLGLIPVMLYDGDEKGRKSIKSAMDLIYSKGTYPLVVMLPDGYDLADYSLELKEQLSEAIDAAICTYGFMEAQNLIANYLKDLYRLKAKYRPYLNELLEKVPEQEREEIKTFLNNELRMF